MHKNNTADVFSQLDGLDFKLLELLSFLSQERGFCMPGREYLAKRLGVSICTISRHTRWLAHLGILQVVHRSRRRKDGTIEARSNVYRVLGAVGRKVRQLFQIIKKGVKHRTGVAGAQPLPEPGKKVTSSDLSFVKDVDRRVLLERFSRLGEH